MAAMVFRGGLPYGPDIKRLDDAFPVDSLTEGRVIEHGELEKILTCKRGSSRYYGVIDTWIGQRRSANGIVLVWEPTRGLKVLNPAEILEHAEVRTRQKIRQTGRAIRIFGLVDRERLDGTGQKRLDHQMRVVSTLKESLESSRKQLAIELAPVKSLPKRKID